MIESSSTLYDRSSTILLRLIPDFKANRNASAITLQMAHACWDMVFPLEETAFAHLITIVREAAGTDCVALVKPCIEQAIQDFENRVIIDVNTSFAKYCFRKGLKRPVLLSSDSNIVRNRFLSISVIEDIIRTLRGKN